MTRVTRPVLTTFLILFGSLAIVWSRERVAFDSECRHAVQEIAPSLFADFRFPEVHEVHGDWKSYSVATRHDPACRKGNLDIDEFPDYAVVLLPRESSASGFALFALVSFTADGTPGSYTVYPLHAETRGVLGETVVRKTKRNMLRDDNDRALSVGKGWLEIAPPGDGEAFAWCRNLEVTNPRRSLDSIDYVTAFDAERRPSRFLRFHWNTAGYFTRRSYCRIDELS